MRPNAARQREDAGADHRADDQRDQRAARELLVLRAAHYRTPGQHQPGEQGRQQEQSEARGRPAPQERVGLLEARARGHRGTAHRSVSARPRRTRTGATGRAPAARRPGTPAASAPVPWAASGFEMREPGTGPSAANASNSERHGERQRRVLGESRDPLHQLDRRGRAAQRIGEHQHHVPGRERRAALQHDGPPPLSRAVGGVEQQLLREVGAARHDAHQRQAGNGEREHGDGHRARHAAEVGDPVVAERGVDEARRHEHAGLGGGMRDRLQQSAGQDRAMHQRAAAGIEREREHQEQVADLRDRRIGDQQLQALLPQRDDAADDDGRRTQARQQLRGRQRHHAGHDVEPQAHDQEPRALDHQRRQHRARGGRRAGMRGRQPDVQREQCRLGQQAHRHQRGGGPGDGLGLDAPGQQRDVQRAVAAVQQHGAQQVQQRAGQREQQVAQRGAQRLAAAVEADQRHARERQQFERDVQREQVAADEHQVERSPHRQQQQPEDEGRALLGLAGGAAEVGPGVDADAADDHGDGEQHRRRQAVGPQRDAERRCPAAEQVDHRVAGLHQCPGDAGCNGEADRQQQRGHALRIASAQREPGEHADERRQHREQQQPAAGRRQHDSSRPVMRASMCTRCRSRPWLARRSRA